MRRRGKDLAPACSSALSAVPAEFIIRILRLVSPFFEQKTTEAVDFIRSFVVGMID